LTLLCLLVPTFGMASESFKLLIAQWAFDDIKAKNLSIDIKLTTKGFGLTASADSIQLAAPIGRLNKIKLNCEEVRITAEQFSCTRGKIAFKQKELGQQKVRFNLTAMPDKQHYKIKLTGLKIASAPFTITADINHKQWHILANTPQILLTPLIKTISPYLDKHQLEIFTQWSVDGKLKVAVDLFGRESNIKTMSLDVSGKDLNISDTPGQYVTEAVASSLHLDVEHIKQDWQWQAKTKINNGQAYGEPIFIDFTATPVIFKAKGLWRQSDAVMQVSNMMLNQQTVMQMQGNFIGNLENITLLNLTVKKTSIAKMYEAWIQPFVVGTAIDNLELAGDISLQYQQHNTNYQIKANLEQAYIHQATELFSIDDVSGVLGWTNYNSPIDSTLSWKNASVYAIPLGSSTINARTESSTLSLFKPWSLPILDGELKIKQLKLQYPNDEHLQWEFDGELTPISMETLSTALDWPVLHGKLSGVIPRVSYVDHQITVDGALKVNLFEGNTIIRDLTLNKPFGTLPQLRANISLKEIDLETLTQTFDFGKITGKLDGKINNLRLSNWQPVQFDASFATPINDKSRHRISQQAVNNLSQLGGGAAGALQRSFLRFFENFSYQRLGLSCKLRNEVCDMSGVGEAKQGYYIVKGGGFPPRINVVGYTRRVNWPDLIERLKAVSKSSGPIVK